jgi:hypothetical protein
MVKLRLGEPIVEEAGAKTTALGENMPEPSIFLEGFPTVWI